MRRGVPMQSYVLLSNNFDANAGFRHGARGTHTSRTAMVAEIDKVLRTHTDGKSLNKLVLEENILEKTTMAGRTLTLQRLKELYALDNKVPLFRVLSVLYNRDSSSLPLLAL